VRREHDQHVGALHHGHQVAAVLDYRVALQELDLAAWRAGHGHVAHGPHVGVGDGLVEGDHRPCHSLVATWLLAGTSVRKPFLLALRTASAHSTSGGWGTHGHWVWSTLVSTVCRPM